jgi:uncharacterized protein YcfJ
MDLNTVYITCCYGKSVVQWMMIANACMTVYRKSKSLLHYDKNDKNDKNDKRIEDEPFVWIEVVPSACLSDPVRI